LTRLARLAVNRPNSVLVGALLVVIACGAFGSSGWTTSKKVATPRRMRCPAQSHRHDHLRRRRGQRGGRERGRGCHAVPAVARRRGESPVLLGRCTTELASARAGGRGRAGGGVPAVHGMQQDGRARRPAAAPDPHGRLGPPRPRRRGPDHGRRVHRVQGVVVGYFLVEADDRDEALDIARQIPVRHGGVEIRPIRVAPRPSPSCQTVDNGCTRCPCQQRRPRAERAPLGAFASGLSPVGPTPHGGTPSCGAAGSPGMLP
jgi:hypothetical protein